MLLVEPGFGQEKATITQGVAVLTRIGGHDTGLTVGDLAECTTPLTRHADRVLTLFGKLTPIQDQHAAGCVTQGLRDQLLVVREDGLVVPGALADELLQRLDIAAGQGEGHRLNRLALQVEQLAVEIGQRPVALLGTPEEWGELGVVGEEFVGQGLNIRGNEVDLRRATGRGWYDRADGDDRSHIDSPTLTAA